MRSIQFFTIVLNGKPFIQYHLPQFLKLDMPWHWHVVEGVAALNHDTAWSRRQGGSTSGILHRDGLSADGTSEYLDQIAARHPEHISIYRKDSGCFWDGKLEMVSAPLTAVREPCLLWQVDADELWTSSQISTVWELFCQEPERTAARFYCSFFVGPQLVTDSINTYGNHANYGEWLRVWQYLPGDRWKTHEPPVLGRQESPGIWRNIASIHPFSQTETAHKGLVFRHCAYMTEKQLAFKEQYYGYTGALTAWYRLQQQRCFPLRLAEFFPWVQDETTVVPFFDAAAIRTLLLVRTDALGDALLTAGMLPYLSARFPQARLVAVCRQNLAELYQTSPFVAEVVPVDRPRAYADAAYLHQLVETLRGLKPEVSIHAAWSRDSLGDLLVLQSGATITVAHDGDLCNISSAEKEQNDRQYSYLSSASNEQHHELQHHAALLRLLGIQGAKPTPAVWVPGTLRVRARQFYRSAGLVPERTVALFVSGTWRGKCYLRYPEALGELFREQGFSMLLLGEEQDWAVHQDLLTKLGVPGVNLAGKTTILEAATLLQCCRLAIGIDTGLAHLACGVGTPNVVLVGGYQFGRYFPYSPLTTVACLPLDCWQCNGHCRYERAHCIFDMEPSVLRVAVQTALAQHSPEQPLVVCQGHQLWLEEFGRPAWRSLDTLITEQLFDVVEVE